jgi:hypothetical protein
MGLPRRAHAHLRSRQNVGGWERGKSVSEIIGSVGPCEPSFAAKVTGAVISSKAAAAVAASAAQCMQASVTVHASEATWRQPVISLHAGEAPNMTSPKTSTVEAACSRQFASFSSTRVRK